MIQETINKITEIEKEADAIMETAFEDAKQTVIHADEESQKIRVEIREKVKVERRNVINLANEDGNSQYDVIIEEGKQACEHLKNNTNKTPAVEFISKAIYSKYIN